MQKIKNSMVSLLMLLCIQQSARACDVCGCSAGTQSLGLLPQSSGNYIGVQYLGYRARSEHPDLFDQTRTENSRQHYDNWQLSARIWLNKRFQLLAYIPALHYQTTDSNSTQSRTGPADAAVQLGYSIPLSDRKSQFLLLSAGVKMPVGKYLPSDGTLLSPISTGSGSWDLCLGISYTRRMQRWGYNTEASLLLTNPNKQRYKFGNRTVWNTNVFRRMERGKFTLMPQCGLRVEYSLHDYDNYDRKWLNEQSGGILSFFNIGGQILYRSAGIRLLTHVPAIQHYASGYVRSGPRWEAGVFLLF